MCRSASFSFACLRQQSRWHLPDAIRPRGAYCAERTDGDGETEASGSWSCSRVHVSLNDEKGTEVSSMSMCVTLFGNMYVRVRHGAAYVVRPTGTLVQHIQNTSASFPMPAHLYLPANCPPLSIHRTQTNMRYRKRWCGGIIPQA